MELVKLKIVNLSLSVLRIITLKLLYYQAKYKAEDEVQEVTKKQNFDLRGMKDRVKNVMLHDQDIIDKRWAECEKCEFLIKPTNNCKKCGCFMKVKTRVATARCPIGKWEKEYNFIKGQAVNGTQPTS